MRPYMLYLKWILYAIIQLLLLIPIGLYALWQRNQLMISDYVLISILVGLMLFSIMFSAISAHVLMERTILFAKWDRLVRLSRFLYENNYVYEKKSSDGKRKFRFPRIYIKQKKFDLEVSFELAGSKFQEKFKKIGGDLETTFAMDFMETEDDERFKMFRLAYSALIARIKTTDVKYILGKGVELMKGFFWDFVSDPHMMVVGGTGGGKTVFLRTLILALAKIGVVDICDPKRADFATMTDIEAFRGRVYYDTESIVEAFENALKIMEERYDFMRAEQKRLGHKDMKTFFEYGLEPYFIVCDEFNSLKAMLDYKMADRLDRAFGQFLLLGRQAGCFGIVAMQKPSREDLGSKLQANINFRIAVGRLDEMGYDIAFEEVNRNKEFKFMKYVGGIRVFGRGYAAVKGQVAREFYSPELVKGFSFFDAFSEIERHEHKHKVDVEQDETEENPIVVKPISQPFPGIIEPELDEKETYDIASLCQLIGQKPPTVRKLIGLIKENNCRNFSMVDGRYVFSSDDVFLFEDLFEQKESFEGDWKSLLEKYFKD